MKTSHSGIDFIEAHEGFVSRAYLDPVGVLTIGTGFTNRSGVFRKMWGRKLKPGDTITRTQNQRILKEALANEYEPPVESGTPADAKQHEFDAAVSATFNLGARFMSWKAAQLWKAGNRSASAEHWANNYNKAGGRKLPGLVRRRKEEAHLFLTGEYAGVGEGTQRKEIASRPAKPDPVVKEAQVALKRFGFDPGEIDGWMGRNTKAAVMAYQNTHPHLTNDGIIGPATMAQLRRDGIAVRDAAQKGGGLSLVSGIGAAVAGFPWLEATAFVAVLAAIYFAWRYRDVIQRRFNKLFRREVA
ncbi:peptidoglycan-binding protein [uncultured Roseibium sp.]|uniref:glycoside hydrolase family protein n=1 Tax=uncultured Roseibium sp. TaxID=1936171 RepID=UPI00261F9481|nr:peptidoglycan-binding protein [uncultured Roseibium sp.]